MADTFLGVTLPVRYGKTGYFESTTDPLTQVKSNLINLLLTARGERPMQPSFGSDLYSTVFEATSDNGQADMESSIQDAVKTWMPFIQVNDVTVTPDLSNVHSYFVNIQYTLLTTNVADSVTLSF